MGAWVGSSIVLIVSGDFHGLLSGDVCGRALLPPGTTSVSSLTSPGGIWQLQAQLRSLQLGGGNVDFSSARSSVAVTVLALLWVGLEWDSLLNGTWRSGVLGTMTARDSAHGNTLPWHYVFIWSPLYTALDLQTRGFVCRVKWCEWEQNLETASV